MCPIKTIVIFNAQSRFVHAIHGQYLFSSLFEIASCMRVATLNKVTLY